MTEEMPTHIFSIDSKRQAKTETRERPPSSMSSAATIQSTGDQSSEKDKSASQRVASSANEKFTNHDRIATTTTASTSSSSGVSASDQLTKVTTPGATPGDVLGTAGTVLRRVKTEASTLSTKEYFERKQREQIEREKAAANMLQIKSEAAAAANLLSPPAKKVKVDAALSKIESKPFDRDNKYNVELSRGKDRSGSNENTSSSKMSNDLSLKVDPNGRAGAVGSPIITQKPLKSEMVGANKSLGMGDPSDQKSSNIFERMRGSETKVVTDKSSRMPNVAAWNQLSTSDSTQHIKSSSEVKQGLHQSATIPLGSTNTAESSAADSNAIDRNRHDRRPYNQQPDGAGAESSFSKQTDHRRRSSRRDSTSGTALTSPHKQTTGQPPASSDFGSPIPVIGAMNRSSHKRKHSTDSDRQPSPLKLKLSLPPGTAAAAGSSPNKQAWTGTHSSRLAVPSPSKEATSGQALSESQERIRLKVSLSDLRVEKMSNSSSLTAAGASGGGVKLVLSKDKLSGAYQPGANATGTEQHQHRRHHEHHHRSHKSHSHQLQADGQQQQQRSHSRPEPGAAARMPPDKHQRSNAASYGNGHHGNQPAAGAFGRQQQIAAPFVQQPNYVSSTYRIAASIPPPPPPPPPPLPPRHEQPVHTPPPPPLPPQ